MRMLPATTLLGVIDIQERLIAAVPAADFVVTRAARLAEAARILGVRAVLVEQYPRGLGPTPAALAAFLPPAVAKMSFSSCGCGPFAAAVDDRAPPAVESVVLCGFETHVCITQTALDLLARGLAVFIAVDAVASRHTLDHEVALRRLEGAGAILTTTEAILFEWCRTAEHPQFQAVRKLVVDVG
jgi:nicotinamidase-related amidase